VSHEFYAQVYEVVRGVPFGRVTTYGSIALALGSPRWARQVGWALAALPDERAGEVPAHRVILASGGLSPGFAFGAPGVQRALLEDEGIEFDSEGRVPLARYLWEPGD
jgi:methylated-DNA-protein-cysteine methyltransferase related protein